MNFLSVLFTDSQIEKQARRQLRETTFSVLFELGVPSICAIDQVNLLTDCCGRWARGGSGSVHRAERSKGDKIVDW